uniref:Uncharacterized protein n=1 Tax=Lactuca sativa TaxID=4236 RepID=A0A9R1WMK4_LACSA|nr:hypothetical protein LSAT_V11C100027010 [Lactuca sativa]
MDWESPSDAMPWVGLYVGVASLVCTLAMAADLFQGFRQWKLWFPCRFFTINAVSITLIAIAMKLPVDLTTDVSQGLDTTAKFLSIVFLVAMLANFLPSLGLMNDKELLMNIVALGILIITITVNVWIQISTTTPLTIPILIIIMIFSLPWPFSVALTVSASRRILQHKYKELHRLASNHQEMNTNMNMNMNFSYKRLICYVKKHWMMAETGNPQFVVACSSVSSALGVICSVLVCISFYFLITLFGDTSNLQYGRSDYKWSINVIVTIQSIGTIVGSIAPIFRCLSSTIDFNFSKKWIKNHLNVFRVEKHWIQRLQHWKRCHVRSHIPGRHCKKAFHSIKNMILNFCIGIQITVVIICNTICLLPRSFLIFCKSLFKSFKQEPNVSTNGNVNLDQEYTRYVLQVEVETKLSKRILRNALNSMTRLLHESEEKEPSNLIKLLKKSTGFQGVLEFDSDQVPSLHQEETNNCWSLVVVTLTAIAISLPNIANIHVKELLSSMREGLQFVMHVEESLNVNIDLVKARKAARRMWTDVEVYYRWLQIDLQKKAREGRTSKDILQLLGDEAIKIVIEFMRRKNGILDHSLRKFIAANSMYRISQTILLHCNEQENWPNDEGIFEFISTMIADMLSACFTNLPRVIAMKCHDDAIEKREENIRTTTRVLGKSKKILKILKKRQVPNLNSDSMTYVDKWHALPKSYIHNCCSPSKRIQLPVSLSSNQSFVVTIM